MSKSARLLLWFACLLTAVIIFCFWFGKGSAPLFVMGVTFIFALPAWCLYLPLIHRFEDAEGTRAWILLAVGMLIGPACLAVLVLAELVLGVSSETVLLNGSGEDLGLKRVVLPALIAGTLTTLSYVVVLKLWTRASDGNGERSRPERR